MKRLFDIIVSFVCLVLLIPFFIILSIFIFFEDYGPVFFVQSRVGYQGKIFKLIKFRTMSKAPEGSILIDLGNVSRVTRIGKVLRRSKLDELPQLINILKGEMSIVGPRPEVPQYTSIYPEKWLVVQKFKPGLTDYAAIEFRNEEELLIKSENPDLTYRNEILPRKFKFYERYAKKHSFCEDIRIIIKTLYVVIFK